MGIKGAPNNSITELEDDSLENVHSAHPTQVPSFDVEALAVAFKPSQKQLPLDLAVPIRKRGSADGAPLRAAFLLSHVDDRLTIAEIASCAQIPVAEVIDCFTLLSDLGVVELRTLPAAVTEPPQSGAAPRTTRSGLRPKTEPPPKP